MPLSKARQVAVLADTVVSVKDFGAVGDGVKNTSTGVISGTNNFSAFQAALNYLESIGGGALHVPTGKYAFFNTGTPATTQLFIKSNVVLFGDGKESSQLLFNDSAGVYSPLVNVAGTYNYDITIENLGFVSDWGANNDWTQRSHFMSLMTSSRVTINNCLFAHVRYYCLSIGYDQAVQEVKVSNCSFFRSAGDGCSIRNSDSTIVTNNYFKDINDDSIAVHSRDLESEPVQNTAVIANNHIVDSQGIRVQGVKKTTVRGNVITRAHYAGIAITAFGGVEGYTQNFALNICDNVIDTVFNGSEFSALSGGGVRYISLEMPVPTTNGAGYVGYANGSGGIVSPFPHFYLNNTDASASEPETGAWFVNVSNNVLTRSHTTTANYADYGFGQRYGRSGPVNVAVTNATLGIDTASSIKGQIHIENSGRFMSIVGNTLFGGNCGIFLSATSGSAYQSWNDIRISNNQISQYLRDGVSVVGEGNVVVSCNSFNGDPLNSHVYRSTNGKWTFPTGSEFFNTAVRVNGGFSEITGNSFRNVQAPLALLALTDVVVGENVYYCNPVSAGQDTNNIGIGNMTSIYLRGADNVVIMDDDPSSATFDKVLSVCPKASSTIPTSGTYLAGHFVQNTNRSVLGAASSQYVVFGWSRVTTGSAHVLNTDWREVRGLTGT